MGTGFSGYNQFAYCFNDPVDMTDPSGQWPVLFGYIIGVVSSAIAVRLSVACAKNVVASSKGPNKAAVDNLLKDRTVQNGDVELPVDKKGILYNKENRAYASRVIKSDLGSNTNRTEEDISSEIFSHQFGADFIKPLSLFSNILPAKFDLYGRLSKTNVNEGEKLIEIFNIIEVIFEWE